MSESKKTGIKRREFLIGATSGAVVTALGAAGLVSIREKTRKLRTPAEVEAGVYAEIEKLQRDEVPAEELQKVKNNFAAGEFRKLASNTAILMQLIHNEGEGNWREINDAGPKIQAVTAADVKRVANEYFTKENRAVATYIRKPGAPKIQKAETKEASKS